jgi:hypothetical protein
MNKIHPPARGRPEHHRARHHQPHRPGQFGREQVLRRPGLEDELIADQEQGQQGERAADRPDRVPAHRHDVARVRPTGREVPGGHAERPEQDRVVHQARQALQRGADDWEGDAADRPQAARPVLPGFAEHRAHHRAVAQ